jgi:CRISPR-associated endonuclease Cas1
VLKRNLYITKNSEIKRVSNSIEVRSDSNIKKIPISLISNLFLFGSGNLTQGARNFLLKNGVDIFFLSSSGSLNGILNSTKLKSNYKNRLKQYKASEAPLRIAKLFVLRKIDDIELGINKSMERYKKRVKDAKNLDSLRGFEGSASIYLFKKLKEELNTIDIPFERRSYSLFEKLRAKSLKPNFPRLLAFSFVL